MLRLDLASSQLFQISGFLLPFCEMFFMYLNIPMHLWLETIFSIIFAGNWPFWHFSGCRDTMSQFASWTVPVGRIFRSRVLPWWQRFLAEVAFLYSTENNNWIHTEYPKWRFWNVKPLKHEKLWLFGACILCQLQEIRLIVAFSRQFPLGTSWYTVDYPQALCDLSCVPGEDGGFASNTALCLWINATRFAELSLCHMYCKICVNYI